MKKYILLVIALSFSFANCFSQESIKTDTTKYMFNVFNSEDVQSINIDTKHANVRVYTWEKDSISVETTIKILNDNVTITKDLLNLISEHCYKANNIVYSKTTYNEGFSSVIPYSINYSIFVPDNIHVKINNSHGSVHLPNLNNGINLDLEYCDVYVSKIKQQDKEYQNNLRLDFCNVNLQMIDIAEISCNTSEITAGNINKLKIDSEYSKLNFDDIKSIDISTLFDELKAKNTQIATIKGKSSNVEIDNLGSKALIELTNGKISIKNTSPKLSSINLANNNTDTQIKINKNLNFVINGEIENGELICPDFTNNIKLISDFKTQSFSGGVNINNPSIAYLTLFNKNANISLTL